TPPSVLSALSLHDALPICFPGAPGPGLVAGLALARNGAEAPGFLPGSSLEGGYETADAVLAPGGADDDLILDDQRRQRECIAGRSEEHTSELQSPYDLVCR